MKSYRPNHIKLASVCILFCLNLRHRQIFVSNEIQIAAISLADFGSIIITQNNLRNFHTWLNELLLIESQKYA